MFYNDEEFKENEKALPEFFNEVHKTKPCKNKKINKKMNGYGIQNIVKSMSVIWIGILILLIGISIVILFKKDIFAAEIEEISSSVTYENNKKAINLMEIIAENTTIVTRKELVKEERNIDFEIVNEETEQLPKDEQEILQAGVLGIKEVSALKTFANEEFLEEEILESEVLLEPVTQIVKVGTSEFLSINKVHINDIMYVTSNVSLKQTIASTSETVCEINKSMAVTLLEMSGDYCKVDFKGNIGYLKCENLTSSYVTPSIVEENRIEELKYNLQFEVLLNQKSGLTLSDFTKVLSGNTRDEYAIIEANAATFYYAEQTYNINGMFLAAVAIHESDWGMSTIAIEKYNLFGYGAYDGTAYESAYTFENYPEGINTVARFLAKQYLNTAGTKISATEEAEGKYYNGATLTGVNIRYSTDSGWATRVFEHMKYLYNRL